MEKQVKIVKKVNGSVWVEFKTENWHYAFDMIDGFITMAEAEGARYDMSDSVTCEYRYDACKEVLSELLNIDLDSFTAIYAKLIGDDKDIADCVIADRIQEIENCSQNEIRRLRTIGK